MLGTIGFEKYRIRCIIGTELHEREKEQEIIVDLSVECDLLKPAASGSLSDAIDYVQLAEICRELAVFGRYFLLEKYIVDVVSEIRRRYPVKSVSMCARKPAALEGADNCFASAYRV